MADRPTRKKATPTNKSSRGYKAICGGSSSPQRHQRRVYERDRTQSEGQDLVFPGWEGLPRSSEELARAGDPADAQGVELLRLRAHEASGWFWLWSDEPRYHVPDFEGDGGERRR